MPTDPANLPTAGDAPALRQPKLLERLRIHLRTRHYSIRTEQAYIDWARRFIVYHGKRHPQDMGAAEVEAFLSHLAVDRQVSASTQNQAKAALLYLYKQVLGVDLPWLDEVVQAKRPQRLPVVLTPSEVRELLLHVEGTAGLVARTLVASRTANSCNTSSPASWPKPSLTALKWSMSSTSRATPSPPWAVRPTMA